MRVHALAKILGLTSKQVLAQVADFGIELRSAQSSIDRALAERVHSALHGPAASDEPASAPGDEAPAAAPAAESTPESLHAPADLIAEAQIPEQGGLFTHAQSQEAAAAPAEVPVFQAPLFLQPETTEAPQRRRRARREAAAPDEDAPIEVTTGPAAPTGEETADREQTAEKAAEDTTTGGEAADHADDESEGQGRRRRRGRRGRGRGRGESESTGEATETSDEQASEKHAPEFESGPEPAASIAPGPISEMSAHSSVTFWISTSRPTLYIRRWRSTAADASGSVSSQMSPFARRRMRMSDCMCPLRSSSAA